MPDVSEDGKINAGIIRSYYEVKKGFTCFREGDVLFAKITPCMENGKGALVTNLMNGVGYGSTEFHVIRADQEQVLPKYLFSLLNREKIRLAAKQRMTEKSGHRRVPESFYADLDIPLPHIDEQKAYVQEIETIEKQINDLNDQIRANNLIKKEILKKYL